MRAGGFAGHGSPDSPALALVCDIDCRDPLVPASLRPHPDPPSGLGDGKRKLSPARPATRRRVLFWTEVIGCSFSHAKSDNGS
jgi:hypothetical protein